MTVIPARGGLAPGRRTTYSVQIWFAGSKNVKGGAVGSATVRTSARPHAYLVRITACHLRDKQTCRRINGASYEVGGLSAGQPALLSAQITVPRRAVRRWVALIANATSPQSPSASASVKVRLRRPAPSPSPSASSTITPAGSGGTLPPLSPSPAPSALPVLPGAVNPGSAFPAVTPSPGSVTLPAARHAHLLNASATVPLDMPLIGGQLAGLAVLAAAVMIAVARLSLRRAQPPANESKDSST